MNPLLFTSLLGGALASDHRSSLRLMISQPICGGLLTGLALGSLRDGFLAGALLQMLFLGMIAVRGARMPDLALGGVAASALFILSQRETGVGPTARGFVLCLSLALALVVAVAGRAAYRFWEGRAWFLANAARRSVERGRFRLASALHFSTLAVHFVFGFGVTALAVFAFVPAIAAVAGALSGKWCEPLGQIPVLLPFIGAGSLLVLNLTKVRFFMFIAGFCGVLLVMFFRG